MTFDPGDVYSIQGVPQRYRGSEKRSISCFRSDSGDTVFEFVKLFNCRLTVRENSDFWVGDLRRYDEIIDREQAAKELQKQRFGKGGDLLKRRQDLVKPVQDKIYNAIKEIATAKNYGVVFDKSSDLTMLFTNPKYDISDQILENLGYTPGQKNDGKETDKGSDTGTGSPSVNPPKK